MRAQLLRPALDGTGLNAKRELVDWAFFSAAYARCHAHSPARRGRSRHACTAPLQQLPQLVDDALPEQGHEPERPGASVRCSAAARLLPACARNKHQVCAFGRATDTTRQCLRLLRSEGSVSAGATAARRAKPEPCGTCAGGFLMDLHVAGRTDFTDTRREDLKAVRGRVSSCACRLPRAHSSHLTCAVFRHLQAIKRLCCWVLEVCRETLDLLPNLQAEGMSLAALLTDERLQLAASLRPEDLQTILTDLARLRLTGIRAVRTAARAAASRSRRDAAARAGERAAPGSVKQNTRARLLNLCDRGRRFRIDFAAHIHSGRAGHGSGGASSLANACRRPLARGPACLPAGGAPCFLTGRPRLRAGRTCARAGWRTRRR
jgi:hypothetical protein